MILYRCILCVNTKEDDEGPVSSTDKKATGEGNQKKNGDQQNEKDEKNENETKNIKTTGSQEEQKETKKPSIETTEKSTNDPKVTEKKGTVFLKHCDHNFLFTFLLINSDIFALYLLYFKSKKECRNVAYLKNARQFHSKKRNFGKV
jgi:hypothetical protein